MLWYIIYDKAGYHVKQELAKVLGLSKDTPEKVYNALSSLTPLQKAYLLRKVMLDQYGGNYPDSDYGLIMYRIAKAYSDIDISGFEKEQQEICNRREERAKERIQSLKSNKSTE